MAIADNFAAIKADLKRLEAEKTPVTLTEKHPLLLDSKIAWVDPARIERLVFEAGAIQYHETKIYKSSEACQLPLVPITHK